MAARGIQELTVHRPIRNGGDSPHDQAMISRAMLSALVPAAIAIVIFLGLLATQNASPEPVIVETPDEVIYPTVLSQVEVAETSTTVSAN